MRLRNFLMVAIRLAVLLAVGARAEAQEMGQVIEEIEGLQAEQLGVLRTLAEESEADAEETPDDASARALAELDRGTVDGVRLEFPILSLHPGSRQRCVAPDVWGRRVAGGGAAAIVEEAGRHAGRLTGGTPRRAPAADGAAVTVEDPRAIGITARQRRDQPPIGCESGANQPLIGVNRPFIGCEGARQRFTHVAEPFADPFP